MNNPDKLKVLYIHGIGGSYSESLEQTDHVPFLERKYALQWANMRTGTFTLIQRNSILRRALKDPFFVLPVVAMPLVLQFLALVSGGSLAPYVLACTIIVAGLVMNNWWSFCKQRAIFSALLKTVKLQQLVLKQFEPDVIVGFSWGGCVCAVLMASGSFKGPAVLINPAVVRLPNMCKDHCPLGENGVPRISMIPEQARCGVVVMQSELDTTVKAEEVHAWCTSQRGVQLRKLPGMGHAVSMQVIGQELDNAISDAWRARRLRDLVNAREDAWSAPAFNSRCQRLWPVGKSRYCSEESTNPDEKEQFLSI